MSSLQHLPALERLVDEFSRLPSIGRKSALRLACHLLSGPTDRPNALAEALRLLHEETVTCATCYAFGDADPCAICRDRRRQGTTICVVEEPVDVLSLERAGSYRGLYHVLGGRLNPMKGVTPDRLRIKPLLRRLRGGAKKAEAESDGTEEKIVVEEIILATSPTVDGEATARCIAEELVAGGFRGRISRIGVGLPMGGDLEYTDELTLTKALEGRRVY